MLLCVKVVQEHLVLSIAVLHHCCFLAVVLQLCPQAHSLNAAKIIPLFVHVRDLLNIFFFNLKKQLLSDSLGRFCCSLLVLKSPI